MTIVLLPPIQVIVRYPSRKVQRWYESTCALLWLCVTTDLCKEEFGEVIYGIVTLTSQLHNIHRQQSPCIYRSMMACFQNYIKKSLLMLIFCLGLLYLIVYLGVFVEENASVVTCIIYICNVRMRYSKVYALPKNIFPCWGWVNLNQERNVGNSHLRGSF